MTLSNLDRVRLLIGDTDSADPQLTDSEVNNFIDERSLVDSGSTVGVNLVAAAADAAGAIAAEYARQFNFSEDGQNFSVSQRYSHYSALERQLRRRAGGASVAVSLGGTEST